MKEYAPWTEEQIKRLNLRQDDERRHPYTCGNDSTHPRLVPTKDGWVCAECDYTQDWVLTDISGEIM